MNESLLNENRDESTEIMRAQLRDAALSPGTERDLYFLQHPLNMELVEIPTTAIENAYKCVCSAVKRRRGIVFWAIFRIGKSTALQMIARNIRTFKKDMAVAAISAKGHAKTSEKVFFGDVCDSLKLLRDGTAAECSKRFYQAIVAACASLQANQFLLFVDEAQNWGDAEWGWIRDASNDLLNVEKISLTPIAFADPQILERRSKFRLKRQDLWGRFMLRIEAFHGMQNEVELEEFLKVYDNSGKREFPAGSGISYTEFYVPIAYEHGWRLSSQSRSLWAAFERKAQSIGRKVDEIGMQWVGGAVFAFLENASTKDFSAFIPKEDAWDVAVDDSFFIESIA